MKYVDCSTQTFDDLSQETLVNLTAKLQEVVENKVKIIESMETKQKALNNLVGDRNEVSSPNISKWSWVLPGMT